MKALIINSVCGIKSTGHICIDQLKEYEHKGFEVKIAYGREYISGIEKEKTYKIGRKYSFLINVLASRIFDNEGFGCKKQTKKFLKWATKYAPDVLILNNLHGYYINLDMLFKWIKDRPELEIKWIMHDCWPITGHCAHFAYINCNKWKNLCHNCEQKKLYPTSWLLDRSKRNYNNKKRLFCGIKKMEIICPSNWMKSKIKESFLSEYHINVIYHNIDSNVFKKNNTNFFSKYNIGNKRILLGVATAWSQRKGIDDFIKLSKILDKRFKIVLIGISENQKKILPNNILCIQKTDNVYELAEAYSSADLFLNLSKEESFGLTTLEAISCETDVIVYKDTACEEIVKKYGGIAVDQDINNLIKVIYGYWNEEYNSNFN